MAVAVLLLADLAIRATDLNVMYTDDGMFPRAEMSRWFHPLWSWSIHSWGGSAGYEALLFGIAATLALAVLLGIQTRIAVIGSWVMLISIQHRVQPILSGAEILLRMLLFWAMFLPLANAGPLMPGGNASATPPPGGRWQGLWCPWPPPAILVQMGLTWLCSAILKTNSQWLHGETLALVFAHDFYASPPAAFFLQYPGFLRVMTVATLVLEWAALLLFVPNSPRLRLVVIGTLAALHSGMGVCLEVGLFPYVSLTGLILFLPSEFWNSRLFTRLANPEDRPQQHGTLSEISAQFQFGGPQFVCLICLLYVLADNINAVLNRPVAALAPERWMLLSKGLGLSQRWGMFEAAPSKDGWYVAWAKLEDGSEVDLLRHQAPDPARPDFPAGEYPNHYWQKLFREMAYTDGKGYQLFRPPVSRSLPRLECPKWTRETRRRVRTDLLHGVASSGKWQIIARHPSRGPSGSEPKRPVNTGALAPGGRLPQNS